MNRAAIELGNSKKGARLGHLFIASALLVSGLLLLTTFGLAPSAADASSARFTYELCDAALPGGAVPTSSHEYSNAFAPFQNCATPGGSIGLVESEPASGTFGSLFIAVPQTPGGFVESETITAVQAGVQPGNALHFSHVYENEFPGGSAEATRLFQIRTEPTPFFGSGGGFNVLMSCDLNVGSCSPGPVEAARWIAATEVDPNPPKLSAPTGSILAGGTIRGHQSLAAVATDEGGGVSNLAVFVNNLPLANNLPATTGLPAAPATRPSCSLSSVANKSYVGTVALSPTPCPPKVETEWALNTESYPFHDGTNSVQVCASDFSTLGSPNTTCLPAQNVTVDNSCNGSPVPDGELLSAQFSKSNAETQTVGFGKEAEVIGQLETNAGEPVAGATLCVKMATLGVNAPLANVGTVQTDASGSYSYGVPAGPNRELVIGYRHDTVQIARNVRYYAHAKPTLKAGPKELKNGQHVRLWGSLPEPKAAGRVVVLQANIPGSKRWITFRKATTGERGRFHANYHFTSTTRKIIYRFRAVVPKQAGYPWDQGASKPAFVVVKR